MSHLSEFPHPSTCGSTLCERNSKLIGEPNTGVLDYRKISVKEAFSHKKSLACSETSCRQAFKNVEGTLWDKVKSKWCNDGFAGILDELHNIEQVPLYLQRAIVKLSGLLTTLSQWKQSVLPTKVVTESTDQKKSIVSCHPHTGRIAIIIKENTVKVLNLKRIGESDEEVILRDKRISKITCVAWRPKSSLNIAAGSNNGIIVWLLEPSTVSSVKPGSHAARYLTSDDMNSPVTSINWCSDGILLACSCKNSTSFWVWNILSQSSTPIHRVGSSISFVTWSPCKRRLLSATNSSTFRIWETNTWTCEKWGNLNGKCTNACWSSCGSYLLFSVADEAVIYYAHFYNNSGDNTNIGGCGAALKCADVSKVCFPDGDEEVEVGGFISGMAWDPTDSRLAVTFQGDNGCQRYIALYHTRKTPNLQLIPCGFVTGDYEEVPVAIDFVRGYEKGALLSVYWSSEEISLVPLLFNFYLSSPLLQTTDSAHLETSLHHGVDEIGEVSAMRNNVSLYSATE